jgi:peptide-methionine (S)-S-oxide reductase
MNMRLLTATLGIAAVLGLVGRAQAQEGTGPPQAPSKGKTTSDPAKAGATKAKKAGATKGKSAKAGATKTKSVQADAPQGELEKATFGGGCFWCLEAVFERVQGVKSVVSGYAGGTVPNPSYEMVCTGMTGHAEVVQIAYDPAVVSYEGLLKVFWDAHDPTTPNSQGPDFGTQYRSIILYHNDGQRQAAHKSLERLTLARAYPDPIVTEIVPLTKFYPAERYHQDYYRRHRYDDYSQEIIAPKLEMLKYKSKGAQNPR